MKKKSASKGSSRAAKPAHPTRSAQREPRADARRAASDPNDPAEKDAALEVHREHAEGSFLTTDQGIPIPHTDDSLKAGARGPTLIEDFHLREKLTRFDHERIPERVVHARGSGAHGCFQVYKSLEEITRADFLCDPSLSTPVFVRFSTVVGSRGAADTARDVRGFAVKFYTREGNFDLVGNNMPVFFIQDGIKFPDLVHAVKPEPHHEMPQGGSAHDTFWDFVSLVPETMHMVMWVLSDRALPRSFRMMEGFGVHTFRLVNADGATVLCKFHWKPLLGAYSLLWDEAQKIAGKDPDFHRRDLWNAIECGAYPEYELGLQVIREEDELAYGFDLLDPTKLVPEELVPVRRVGKLTLNRNPQNFFAETEQVAYCVGNLVPGIDVTNDPLMQARLFSYLDTQLTRLGGPNFAELPINRPIAPVHNHQQDGSGLHTLHTARALYHPNTIAGNRPALAPHGFTHVPERVSGVKIRERSESFGDHFTQARMFLNSQSAPERAHLVDAARFELGKVERLAIRQRVIDLFQQIDTRFAQEVARAIGVVVDPARAAATASSARKRGRGPDASPALSLANLRKPGIRTRKIALLAAHGVRLGDVEQAHAALCGAGAQIDVVAPALGALRTDGARKIDAQMTFLTAASVVYDAVYVPGGAGSVASLKSNAAAVEFVREAYQHAKPIGASNEGVELLVRAQIPDAGSARARAALFSVHGVVIGKASAKGADLAQFLAGFTAAIEEHRHFERENQRTTA